MDYTLKKALEELISAPVTPEKMAKMKDFDWSEYRAEAEMYWEPLDSLEGLQQASNLKNISLDGNHIEDLTPLANMLDLEEIWLYANNVKSVEPLKNLTKLKTLLLDTNKNLTDISALAHCTSLEYLNISQTQVTDIQVLQKLENLKKLSIYRTPIDMNKDENFETLKILAQRGVEIHQ
jgi:internalin A